MNRYRSLISGTPARWLVLALALMLAGRAGGQTVPAPTADETPTIEAVEAKIAELEAAQDIEEAVKTKALESYRAALNHLKAARTNAANLAAYREIVESGPAEIKSIRAELKSGLKPIEPPIESLEARALAEVEGALTREQARVGELQRAVADLTATIQAQDSRPAKIREEVTQARERLGQIEAELKSPPEEGNPRAQEARATLLRARKAARASEVQMLEQELVIFQPRLDLLTARRDLAQRQLSQQEERVKAITEMIGRKRRAEAERARIEAEIAREAARGKHPALVKLAEETTAFSRDLADLSRKIEDASRTHQEIVDDLKRVEAEHQSAKTKLERVGLSGMLGEIFLEQRKNVPDLERYRRATAQHRDQIATVRLGQLAVDDRRRRLSDPERALDEITRDASPPVGENEADEFRAEARGLLTDQAALLEKLDSAYGRYLKLLGDLDFDQRHLADTVRNYRAFLDEHLLWTPSAPALGLATLRDLPSAVAWFLAPENWNATLRAAIAGLTDHPLTSTLGLLALAFVFLSRRWSRTRLETIATRVRRKHADSFLLTITAFLLSALLAAPLAVLLGLIAWLLVGASPEQTFPHSVGVGLGVVAGMLFLLNSFRVLFTENGVAQVHFRWKERVVVIFRRTIPWLVLFGLPALFVASMTGAHENDAYRHSLGRLSFMAGMIVVAFFAARVLAPRGGALEHTMAANPNSWLTRLRFVWYFIVVAAPLAIAALAGAGYYYTARTLDHRLLSTTLIIVGAIMLHNLIVRWLVIARTRLAIARAKEKREAALVSREESEEEPETLVDLDIPEIDLATIKQQTQRLFKTAIVLATFGSLIGIWADVLPALAVLDRQLWESRVMVAGEEVARAITIGSVLFALLVAVLSFVSAKNLPGFLEVALLRRLSVDAGSRYAIATIGQYVLVAVGLAIAFRAVGVAWSHVQWLVAALGVGLGFGLQEIFANFVSGVIILLERPIRVGDTVTIGDISGTVTRIRIRATTITDWDQKELVVPNKSFITGQLVNWSLSNPVTRLIVKVGIAYGSDTELALRLMMHAAKEHPRVLEEPEPAVFFVGFGDSALNFEVRVFVKELSNRGRTKIVHDLHLAIDRSFREHGIVIAFPQRDIHIKSDERLTDGVPRFPQEFGTGVD